MDARAYILQKIRVHSFGRNVKEGKEKEECGKNDDDDDDGQIGE